MVIQGHLFHHEDFDISPDENEDTGYDEEDELDIEQLHPPSPKIRHRRCGIHVFGRIY